MLTHKLLFLYNQIQAISEGTKVLSSSGMDERISRLRVQGQCGACQRASSDSKADPLSMVRAPRRIPAALVAQTEDKLGGRQYFRNIRKHSGDLERDFEDPTMHMGMIPSLSLDLRRAAAYCSVASIMRGDTLSKGGWRGFYNHA